MRLAHIASYLIELFSRPNKRNVTNSIYDFKLKGLNGKEVDFANFKGQKLLIVNTASKCGLTPQYAELEKLHEQYGGKVKVLGFPANNFFKQEPGNSEDIAEFCQINYGVSFQMFEKISVTGDHQHPLYQWLEAKAGRKPDWNFAKYMVSEDGSEVDFFRAGLSPLDKKIVNKIVN
jgi:glutathione peroxidase